MTKINLLILLTVTSCLSNASPIDMSLPDMHGNIIKLSDYRGKWVVVNYWATWCPPCLEEIPELVSFHEKHADIDAVVLGVNHETIRLEKITEFVDNQMINYPILLANEKRQSPLGYIAGLPTTFLLTPKGELIAKQSGGITRASIENFINKKKAESLVKKNP